MTRNADVAGFYGRWASLYDSVATAPGVGRWRRVAAERTAREGDVVVDVGCGSGANLPHLRQRVGPDGRVVGIDITGPLLDRARERAARYDNVSVVRGDARALPVAEADAVLGTFVCGLFETPGAVVERWCELVGPGGRVGILDATASEDLRGRVLNPVFRSFVALGSPAAGVADALTAPLEPFDAPLSHRVETSRAALTERTVGRRYEEFGLGFVGLLTGTVADEHPE
jgi:ubiquinone/menaquinone biosynthesis C-methylase UbiE